MVGEGPVVGISGAGEEEHAEGNAALLAVLELVGTDTQAFEDDVSDGIRGELGEAFSVERNRQIDAGCGHIENVKKLVNAAKRDGLLEKN